MINTEFEIQFRIFYLKIMKEKNNIVPDELLSKEFLSQFKTESDVK